MSITQESGTLQLFTSRFVEEIEFYALMSGTGQVTGEQIGEVALDIIRIDLQRSDVAVVIEGLPAELRNLLLHASQNPLTTWAAHRQIQMVKKIGRAHV